MKIIYLRLTEINGKWPLRPLRDSINVGTTKSGKCSGNGVLYKYTNFGMLCTRREEPFFFFIFQRGL